MLASQSPAQHQTVVDPQTFQSNNANTVHDGQATLESFQLHEARRSGEVWNRSISDANFAEQHNFPGHHSEQVLNTNRLGEGGSRHFTQRELSSVQNEPGDIKSFGVPTLTYSKEVRNDIFNNELAMAPISLAYLSYFGVCIFSFKDRWLSIVSMHLIILCMPITPGILPTMRLSLNNMELHIAIINHFTPQMHQAT